MNTGLKTDEEKPKSDRTKAREAFFLEFAHTMRREVPDVPLMVTGGFRTRRGVEAAISEGGCDLAGIGRPATVNPILPKDVILNPTVKDDDAVFHVKKIQPGWLLTKLGLKMVGAAADSVSLLGRSVDMDWQSLTLSFLGSLPKTTTTDRSHLILEVMYQHHALESVASWDFSA